MYYNNEVHKGFKMDFLEYSELNDDFKLYYDTAANCWVVSDKKRNYAAQGENPQKVIESFNEVVCFYRKYYCKNQAR